MIGEHKHTPSDENFNRGYEWWTMVEAKKRNPGILFLVSPYLQFEHIRYSDIWTSMDNAVLDVRGALLLSRNYPTWLYEHKVFTLIYIIY